MYPKEDQDIGDNTDRVKSMNHTQNIRKYQILKTFRINSQLNEGNNMPINQSSIKLSHKSLHSLGGPILRK
jgi:hypothetical protein